jgi:basic membrane protein A and related proteins
LLLPRLTRLTCLAGILGVTLIAAGCGSDDSSSTSSTSGGAAASTPAASTSTPAAGPKLKVGLVTDIGGLNDRSFNALANQGLQDSIKNLGIDGRVLTSKSNADYVPNLSTLAQQKYDLVIGVGFLMADAMDTVAKKFPDTKFAIIDVDATTLKGKPSNVEGLLFKENEAGYLAGYASGLIAKAKGFDTVSSVGGQKIPPVDGYIAGFQAGAKKADPGIKTLNGYSQDFVDQAKCKELALNQISQGSGIVFQVAGQCGLGALDAAKSQGKYGIGVDADQAYLGDYIITSAQKKVNVAVEDTIKDVQNDAFKGGTDRTFDLKTEGVGLGKLQGPATAYTEQLNKVSQDIVDGKITIPDTVK